MILHEFPNLSWLNQQVGKAFAIVMAEARSKMVRVKEGFFFLSNPAQNYTLEIKEQKPTNTFNVHFGEYFADQVFQSLAQPLLENRFEVPSEGLTPHNFIAVGLWSSLPFFKTIASEG